MFEFPAHATVVPRAFSPAQAAGLRALTDAAIELAAVGGYEAAGVREVAAAAGMSAARAYQLVGSKDELLVHALLSLSERSTHAVRTELAVDASPATRLGVVLDRIMRQIAARPLLYRALLRAYLSDAASIVVASGLPAFGPDRAGWILEALFPGDDDPSPDRRALTESVSLLFLGAMVSVAAGRDVGEVRQVLDRTVDALLGELE
ncbi:TetR/AcrR family transcriptional regulator [Branchiibius hedensis]|uniref:TetR/AcrR family transcriptional regulator n=1 Tax=Branchiibius hedensis TaxID=672460 RepID=UPI001476809C|nr:TetR family transcriptional regulator [Branchiibius hedensis]